MACMFTRLVAYLRKALHKNTLFFCKVQEPGATKGYTLKTKT